MNAFCDARATASDRSRNTKRVWVVAAIALGGLFAAGPAARSASADSRAGTPGACPNKNGVTVVVNFGRLGGGTEVRCAPGAQADGFAALQNAGFGIARALRAPGFVCRINSKPSPSADSCVNESPADAYWSYWQGESGSWVYSDLGAGYRTPAAGGIEGWAFTGEERVTPSSKPPKVGSSAPTTVPSRPPATRPTRPTTTTRAGQPAPPATTGASGRGSGQTPPTIPAQTSGTGTTTIAPRDSNAGPTSTTSSTVPGSPTTVPTSTGERRPSGGASAVGSGIDGSGAGAAIGESKRIDVMGASEERMLGVGDDGPPLATLGGVGVVAGLAATASVVQRRRRAPSHRSNG